MQDLRRKIYLKAKADPAWRFWGLYVHVCKRETLEEAYKMAKANDGAPGIEGVTCAGIEQGGVEPCLEQIRDERLARTYRPMPNRKTEIPKDGGPKVRVLSMPAIRDRVVQGALKLILEPLFEADCQDGSYGYRPKRTAQQAGTRVAQALAEGKPRGLAIDLKAYFDTVRHAVLWEKVARRVADDEILHLLAMILKAAGKRGVAQGGVLSPVLRNLDLTEVDRMLERAQATTRAGQYPGVEYARYADDLVLLVDAFPPHDWLLRAVEKRLREEVATLGVEINEEKSRLVELAKGESLGVLGFDCRRIRSRRGVWRPHYTPKLTTRTAVVRKLKEGFRRAQSQPVERIVKVITPSLRGWVNYLRIGYSGPCVDFSRQWVEKKIRRHGRRAKQRHGFGWQRGSLRWGYAELGLFNAYRIHRPPLPQKALLGR